jgi:2-iminobutanoate/2-iminopropanoate deaminase
MPERRVISTDEAPAAIGPYSQAIVHGDLVFCSGQIGMNAAGELSSGELEDEVRQAMANLGAVLRAAGSSYDKVLRAELYLADMADFGRMNAVYGEYFQLAPPARACIQAAALPRGARFEITATASL